MNFTEIPELCKALVIAQSNMEAVRKNSQSTAFGQGRGTYKYADMKALLDAVVPALNNAGIAVIQRAAESPENCVVMETILVHESGQAFSSLSPRIPVDEKRGGAQGVGSAVTYARRYGLLALVGVGAEDDDGKEASGNTPQKRGRQSEPEPPASTLTYPTEEEKKGFMSRIADDLLAGGVLAKDADKKKTQDTILTLVRLLSKAPENEELAMQDYEAAIAGLPNYIKGRKEKAAK